MHSEGAIVVQVHRLVSGSSYSASFLESTSSINNFKKILFNCGKIILLLRTYFIVQHLSSLLAVIFSFTPWKFYLQVLNNDIYPLYVHELGTYLYISIGKCPVKSCLFILFLFLFLFSFLFFCNMCGVLICWALFVYFTMCYK